jgi:hypothetical protein
LEESFGFGELIEEHMTDLRANDARFPLVGLLRQ